MSDREQKNEKRETLADIVKELRRQSDGESKLATQLRRSDDDLDYALASCYAEDAKYLSQIADRIEAAWKREKAEIESDALAAGGIVEAARRRGPTTEKSSEVGNAATMREALLKCRDIALQWQADEAAGVAGTTDKPHARSASEAVIDMEFEINAALSAPARNCDLPLVVNGHANNNADKAWLVFKRHNSDAYFDASGLLRCIDWLFAPAAERKGDGDENK